MCSCKCVHVCIMWVFETESEPISLLAWRLSHWHFAKNQRFSDVPMRPSRGQAFGSQIHMHARPHAHTHTHMRTHENTASNNKKEFQLRALRSEFLGKPLCHWRTLMIFFTRDHMKTLVLIQVNLWELDQSRELVLLYPLFSPVREAPMLSELFCNYMI